MSTGLNPDKERRFDLGSNLNCLKSPLANETCAWGGGGGGGGGQRSVLNESHVGALLLREKNISTGHLLTVLHSGTLLCFCRLSRFKKKKKLQTPLLGIPSGCHTVRNQIRPSSISACQHLHILCMYEFLRYIQHSLRCNIAESVFVYSTDSLWDNLFPFS